MFGQKKTHKKICLISDCLYPPYDEGMKVVAREMAIFLAKEYGALIVATAGDGINLSPQSIIECSFGKTLLSGGVLTSVRKLAPDIIIYMPWASLTLSSIARGLVIRTIVPRSDIVLVGLQPRKLGKLAHALALWLQPKVVLLQDRESMTWWKNIGCRSLQLRSGVDLKKFRVAVAGEKVALRQKYRFGINDYIVLHVGHLVKSRNLTVLEKIAKSGTATVLMVASSTISPDVGIARRMKEAGVLVIQKTVDHIEEFYRLADVYVFPVIDPSGAIGMPLSVLEALSSGLPVISTRFGALKEIEDTAQNADILLVDSAEKIVEILLEKREMVSKGKCVVSKDIEQFGWSVMLDSMREILQ